VLIQRLSEALPPTPAAERALWVFEQLLANTYPQIVYCLFMARPLRLVHESH